MNDLQAIMHAVDEGYIRGIHREGDRGLIEKHFHEEFSMFLRDEKDEISIMKIGEWIERIEKRKKENPDSYKKRNVAYEIKEVHINEGFASLILDLYYDNKLFAIDQFLFYKLNGSWKFMAKVYKM